MKHSPRIESMLSSPRSLAAVALGSTALALPSSAAAVERQPESRAAETPAALVTASQVTCSVPVETRRQDGPNDEVVIRKWRCAKDLGRAGTIKTVYRDVDFYNRRGDTYYTHSVTRESVRRYDAQGRQVSGSSAIIIGPQRVMAFPPGEQPRL